MTWHGGFTGVGFDRSEFRAWLSLQKKPTYPRFLVAHNTASPYIVPPVKPSTRIQNLGHYYQKDKGWPSGPSLIVILDKVYGGTPLVYPGVNSPGYNGRSIGVECEGDYRTGKHDPKSGIGAVAWDTMGWVFAELLDWYGWACDDDHVKLHREDPETTHKGCPGNLVTKDWFLGKIRNASDLPPSSGEAQSNILPFSGPRLQLYDVREIQGLLLARGYDLGKWGVDGINGKMTDSAIRAYQTSLDVGATGVLGPWAMSHLRKPPKPVTEPPIAPQPIPSPSVPVLPLTNAQKGVAWLMDAGWPRHWAAGAVGNLQRESYPSLKPEAAGDYFLDGKPSKRGVPGAQPTAFGIGQWRGNRKEALLHFAQSRGTEWYDLETQILFVPFELKASEHLAWKWLQQATNVEQACDAMILYERPKGYMSLAAKSATTWDEIRKVAEACDGWKERQAFARALA